MFFFLVSLGHISIQRAKWRQAKGLGTGTSGWERVVRRNPCKHLALSEGMRGVGGGVKHWSPSDNEPRLNPPTTLPTPPSLLYVPQSSCLTNWCFFFTAIWSCPCCADGKLSGKCYFIPQLNCLFSFNFSHFFVFLSSEHQCYIGFQFSLY